MDPSCILSISEPGVYEYFVKYDTHSTDPQKTATCTFVVEPRLYLHNHDTSLQSILPLDGICMLTVIPKWLPKMNEWEKFFDAFNFSGYNMIHFAPVNERGSKLYLIHSHLEFIILNIQI